MKYTKEIQIDLPIDQVVTLFDNPDNMAKWQPGLVSFEHQTGIPGEPGATSKIVYQMGKRRIEMIETVIQRNLPEIFNGVYETAGVKNWSNNSFVAVGANQTKWIAENEFKFSGFMKLMGLLMPKAFSKQTGKYMQQFKVFAEGATAEMVS